ncbi:AraC family transcriptional regulator [Verrucomicrobium sp. BvORR106]|uniref:helix-turn-helix domain-containing protein n=1 Tax=Verrucomicrobium sp. BvORR106 TaxID=1403819 RepID=UPI0005702235|nr:AraC family transcriptional regulator [Verrucomicrobium sp. BvORR106]
MNIPLHLYDPRRGEPAFRVERLEDARWPEGAQRANYFTVLWLPDGGTYHAGEATHALSGAALVFFQPYQIFHLERSRTRHPDGTVLQFHANFLCIETHHDEIGCNGVLFNEVYGSPHVPVDGDLVEGITNLVTQMRYELDHGGLAHTELLVSYLKVLLIKATRRKLELGTVTEEASLSRSPEVVDRFVELVERHYQKLHAPADYATMLHLTPKALGRAVKRALGRTPTQIVKERLIKHAQWQLLHTLRPVKEIAAEVGLEDEFYFSRLFKQAIGLSPVKYREFETTIRGGRNLSM